MFSSLKTEPLTEARDNDEAANNKDTVDAVGVDEYQRPFARFRVQKQHEFPVQETYNVAS